MKRPICRSCDYTISGNHDHPLCGWLSVSRFAQRVGLKTLEEAEAELDVRPRQKLAESLQHAKS